MTVSSTTVPGLVGGARPASDGLYDTGLWLRLLDDVAAALRFLIPTRGGRSIVLTLGDPGAGREDSPSAVDNGVGVFGADEDDEVGWEG